MSLGASPLLSGGYAGPTPKFYRQTENDLFAPLSQESQRLSQEPPGLSQESNDREHLLNELPLTLRQSVVGLGRRARDTDRINGVILALCAFRPFQARELADLLGRRSDYLRRRYITPLLHQGALVYRFPDEPNRPDQAYISSGEDA